MPDYKGIDYLRNKLNFKKSRVRLRYKHYEMKNIVRDFHISTPPDLRFWMGTLGWCAKAVDSIADRLVFREFDNDVFDMNGVRLGRMSAYSMGEAVSMLKSTKAIKIQGIYMLRSVKNGAVKTVRVTR